MNLSSSRENSKFGQGLSLLITLFFDRMRNKTLHIISNMAYPFVLQGAVDKVVVALYNISADPEERDELSAKLPDVVAKMEYGALGENKNIFCLICVWKEENGLF